MEYEHIVIFLLIIFLIIYVVREEFSENFLSAETIPTATDDIDMSDADKSIDNSDAVDQYIYGYVQEQSGNDYLNGKFPKRNLSMKPQFMTFDDKWSADQARRSRHDKTAQVG